jgi:hypothetical protein
MKTAVSLPDPLFRRAEKAAKRLGISRSELYARALGEFLATVDGEAVRASYDRAFGGDAARSEGDFAREAGRQALLAVEW